MKALFKTRKKLPRGQAGADLMFFILFLIVLGVVWSLTGGPDRSISREGPFLNPPFPLGSGGAYNIPTVPVPQTEGSFRPQNSSEEDGSVTDLISRIRAGFGFTAEEESPYANLASLDARAARSPDINEQYVILRINQGNEKPLRVSNWRIESTVTQLGVNIGGAAYLPFSGKVNPELPLDAQPGATIYIVTGRSPIGTSFRTNLCTGYFTQFQKFTPRLDRQCPDPENMLTKKVGAGFIPNQTCIDYVRRLDSCTLTLEEIPLGVGNQCRNFILEDLTYNGCVQTYKNNINFYNNEWYVYLNRDQSLWKARDERIRLLDENGLVIDTISY